MLKSLFCEAFSVEYEFNSVKFKGGIDRLKNEQFRPSWKHNGIQTLTYTYLDCLLAVKMRGHKMAEI